jgi:1-deoxy-D-xylulose-5-phosphate reductoisomerase
MLAQLSNPDMRVPIAHALAWPERIDSGVQSLDLSLVKNLSFERPDPARFPCLPLGYAALRAGGTAPAMLNAANEVAVQAFLAGRLPFTGIGEVIQMTLAKCEVGSAQTLQSVLEADSLARRTANGLVMAQAA